MAILPGAARVRPDWLPILRTCDVLFFDGTFWSDDELIRLQGTGKTARQMGHQPVQDTVWTNSQRSTARKIFIHINNTNPMLDEDSAEFARVRDAGWETCIRRHGRHFMSAATVLSADALKKKLFDVGHERYHHKHPFHLLMHEGKLSREQLQAWALNRYYYQSRIPIKDALILSRSTDADFRRAWMKRVVDHDGGDGRPGGIEKWIRLAEATGLDRKDVVSERKILPGVRYAVDAYLNLVSQRTFLEAVASSLTELFSRDLISLRIDALREHYPWLESGLTYFTARLDTGSRRCGICAETT